MKRLLRAEISITSDSAERIALELESLARGIRGSCRLGEPEGQEKFSEPFMPESEHLMATIQVLPEYQEGDLEKFFGCLAERREEQPQ